MLPRPHTNQQRYELIGKPGNVLGKAQNVARERVGFERVVSEAKGGIVEALW